MNYYLIQTLECQGIPRVEYRIEPERQTQITLKFTPTFPHDDYAYSDPKFVFCEQVILADQWKHCQINDLNVFDECQVYQITSMELVEFSLTGNYLYEAPHWRYGIRGIKGNQDLTWFEEDDLISLQEIKVSSEF